MKMDILNEPVVSLAIEDSRLININEQRIIKLDSITHDSYDVTNSMGNPKTKIFLEIRPDLGKSLNVLNRDLYDVHQLTDQGPASPNNVSGDHAQINDHVAEEKSENSSSMCFVIADGNKKRTVNENTADPNMYTLSSTQLEYQAEKLNTGRIRKNSNIWNSLKYNKSEKRTSSSKDEDLSSKLDHHDRVERESKIVSSCQSLASRVFSWRSMMLLLLHLSFVINTIPRNIVPIAIVCMVKPQAGKMSAVGRINASTSRITEDVLGSLAGGVSEDLEMNMTNKNADDFEFTWDSKTVGLVLSAFSFTSWVGPLFTDVIRGYLGNKWTLTLLTIGSALTTLLSPLAARIGPSVLIGLRVISGLDAGVTSPIVSDTIVWWTPVSERLTASTLTFSGHSMAGIVTFFVAGFLCSIPVDNGWPFVFYIFGAVTLLWTLAWHIMSSQKPEDHRWISDEEKCFIISTRSLGTGAEKTGSRIKPPYRVIMTSVPIIVYFMVTSVHMWCITIIYTYIPAYFSRRLGFTYEEIQAHVVRCMILLAILIQRTMLKAMFLLPDLTGVLVSSVAFCRLFGEFGWTVIGNILMSRPGMTTNKNRKIIFTTGFIVATVFLVTVTFVASDFRWLAASLMFVVMASQSVSAVVMPALAMDMAPRYAGFISGMAMSIAAVVSITGPLMVAALTPTNSQTEWTTVWLIIAATILITAVIFLVFGQASVLPWSDNTIIPTPHKIFPFVQLGRRMKAVMEAPPLDLADCTGDHKYSFVIIPYLSSLQSTPVFQDPTKQKHEGMELAININGKLPIEGEYNPTFQRNSSFISDGLSPLGKSSSIKLSHHEFKYAELDNQKAKDQTQFENLHDSIKWIHENISHWKVAEETYDVRL